MEKIHNSFKRHYSYHKHFIPHYFVIVFYSTVTIFGLYSLFPPTLKAATLEPHRLDQEVRISIWGWADKDSIVVKPNYNTPFAARLQPNFAPFNYSLTLTPKDLLYPETEYKFEVETKNWLGLKTTKTVKVRTEALPKVALQNKFADKTQIAASTTFQFKLSSELDPKHFNFSSTPSFDYSSKVVNDTLTVSPKTKLKQGQDFQVSLALKSQTLEQPLLYTDSFSVIDPLEVPASKPSNNTELVPKQTQPEFVFNKEV